MCTQPIRIRNNSKYIPEDKGHQYYIWVKCGICAECQKERQLEWNLRTYYEMIDTLTACKGNYVYFDTLTYRNEDLPRLTNYIETNENWSCFDRHHIRTFYEGLRQTLKLKKDDKIKYFITSEYGDIRKRPHYHIMLFVRDNSINPFDLSKAVSKTWKYGRTDGMPYKSRNYVLNHNVITKVNQDCIRYVAKYVNKSTTFMEIINKRWNKLNNWYEKSRYTKLQIKNIKRRYYNLTTPFHRQSQNYGIKAIENVDINELIENPILTYRDNTIKIQQIVHLPNYYYRKLFQKQITYNGKRIWINTEDGIKYKQESETRLKEQIQDKIKDITRTKEIEINKDQIEELTNYLLFERGRLKGKPDYLPHHTEAKYFNYNTDRDLKYLGKKCISTNFAGNDKIGYQTTTIDPIEIEEQVTMKNDLEAILGTLFKSKDTTQLNKLKEHMNEIKKIFFQ